jgi:hypothetical protein
MEEEPELSPAAAAKKAMAQLTAPIRSSSRSGSSPGSPECCSRVPENKDEQIQHESPSATFVRAQAAAKCVDGEQSSDRERN